MGKHALILHYDINKTVLMIDPSGDKGVKQAINSAIAESVMGTYDKVEGSWTPLVNNSRIYAHLHSTDANMHFGKYISLMVARDDDKPLPSLTVSGTEEELIEIQAKLSQAKGNKARGKHFKAYFTNYFPAFSKYFVSAMTKYDETKHYSNDDIAG